MKRREFIKTTSAAGIGSVLIPGLSSCSQSITVSDMAKYSSYRGFNLLAKFSGMGAKKKFEEEDFEIMAEWGCYNKTPHHVALAWMEDLLSLWKEVGWGHAMWNLKGDFGPLNSKRPDVKYENYKGHKLDRQMLELLKQYMD